MYPNLKAEFARNNFTLANVVTELEKKGIKMTVGTLSMKMNKKNKKLTFSFDEAVALKQILNTDLPLEDLFEEAS